MILAAEREPQPPAGNGPPRRSAVRLALLAMYATGATACFLGVLDGHEWVTARPPHGEARGESVIYGIDRGATASAAPSCVHLGTVRAWSSGEKTFPLRELRAAAAEGGGDGLTNVRPDPDNRDPSTSAHLADVVRCGGRPAEP